MTSSQSIIYCPMSIIYINNEKYPCPYDAFTMPPTVSFRVGGTRHAVTHKNITATDETYTYVLNSINASVHRSMKIPDLDDILQDLHEA